MKDPKKKSPAQEFRQKAEQQLKKKQLETDYKSSEAGMMKLIHELEVHQVELELQNEELMSARSREEELADKYTALYDFAPMGYLTLSKNGSIDGLNLRGAQMLGKKRSRLINSMIVFFISDESKPAFNQFLSRVFTSCNRETCEIALSPKKNSSIWVHVSGHITRQGDQCLVAMADITEKMQIQKNILNSIALAEEKERSYFSGEIHETLGPLLTAANLYLQMTLRASSKPIQVENLLKVKELLDNAYEIMNEISDKLSPHLLQDYGLTASIRKIIEKFEGTTDLRFTIESNSEARPDAKIEMVLYLVIMECITNTIKHARAKNVSILLNNTGSQLHLQYKDDGIGFEIRKVVAGTKGFGLFNIQNRIHTLNGTIKMNSKAGKGVDYRITIDIK